MSAYERLWRRMQHMVHFGTTSTPTTESGTVSTVQVQHDNLRTIDGVPVVFHFGFAAALPNGTGVVKVNVSGDGSNGVIVATSHEPSRPTFLGPGEAVLYNLAGDHVYMRQNRTIELQAPTVHLIASTQTTLDTPLLQVNGQIMATGNVTAGSGTGAIVTLLAHKHPTAEPGSPSVPTPGS